MCALDPVRAAGFLLKRPPPSIRGGLADAATTSFNSRHPSHILSLYLSLSSRSLPNNNWNRYHCSSTEPSQSGLTTSGSARLPKPSLQNYSDAFRALLSLAPKSGCSVLTPAGAFTPQFGQLSALPPSMPWTWAGGPRGIVSSTAAHPPQHVQLRSPSLPSGASCRTSRISAPPPTGGQLSRRTILSWVTNSRGSSSIYQWS